MGDRSAVGPKRKEVRYGNGSAGCAPHYTVYNLIWRFSDEVVMRKLVTFGGEGGVIAMDRRGNVAMPFNSSGMYRGYIGADGRATTAIYRD